METIASGRPPRPASHAFFAPDLVLRESTRALAMKNIVPHVPPEQPRAKPHPIETWRKTYPFLKEHGTDNWMQLNLSRQANHSMTRKYGWLGADPLLHFPPGLREIHGVPFQVLDERQNAGRAVVTFRSPQSHSADKRELPCRIKIWVKSRVKALYFLHGCGYAKPVAFAKYVMHFQGSDPSSIDLIPLGISWPLVFEQSPAIEPNVQDWWVDTYPAEHFPHAHYATVFDPAEPARYERTIYSLEWINPRPEDVVTFLEVKVDAEAGPALALIAVTALL
jgi:hypothetical protein